MRGTFVKCWGAIVLALAGAPGSTLAANYTVPDTKLPTLTRISDGAVVNPNSIHLTTSGLDAIGVTTLRTNFPQITGTGQTVVVIDTGLDYTHPAIAPNYLTGYDFTTGLPNPMDNWADGGGHGTHVAGIIVSSNPTYPGVAPGARVISLKVFDSTTGVATDANILAALNWVSAHKTQYNITTVNMSLGDSTESTWSSIAPADPYDAAMHTLKQQGVFVSVASGNDAYLHGQSMPGASPNAVSVGATYASDDFSGYIIGYNDHTVLDPYKWPDTNGVLQTARDIDYGPRKNDIAFFTNRYKTAADGQTNLMAPGIFITSTVPVALDTDGTVDGFTDMAGTSMAAPQVAGAAMLVRQALEETGKLDPDPARQVDQILTILQDTGTPLADWFYWFGGNNAGAMFIPADTDNLYLGRGTGEMYDLINVEAAVEAIYGVPEPATLGLLLTGVMGLLLRRRR